MPSNSYNLMQHTDIIQYKVMIFELRWDASGLALRISGVSGLGILISRDLHSNLSNNGLGIYTT
uniref:Uncharacterized protein n=1 Tax=Arundo donax TaxID=35708 RepID=A0A0A9HF91_ARUDO